MEGEKVRLRVIGWVNMAEPVRFEGNIKSATVSNEADQWHVALAIETKDCLSGRMDKGVVGVDLGVKTLATLSTGEVKEGPKAHKRLLGRIKRLSRSLCRKKKGSANMAKAKTKLARMHQRIANVRKDNLHKLTTKLATEFETIGIEDLNLDSSVDRLLSSLNRYEN